MNCRAETCYHVKRAFRNGRSPKILDVCDIDRSRHCLGETLFQAAFRCSLEPVARRSDLIRSSSCRHAAQRYTERLSHTVPDCLNVSLDTRTAAIAISEQSYQAAFGPEGQR